MKDLKQRLGISDPTPRSMGEQWIAHKEKITEKTLQSSDTERDPLAVTGDPLVVTINIRRGDAARAGSTVAGDVKVYLTPADSASNSPDVGASAPRTSAVAGTDEQARAERFSLLDYSTGSPEDDDRALRFSLLDLD